jgi:hypothetical protein
MIRFFLVFNRMGAVRLVKWYTPYSAAEKEKLKTDLHRLVVRRTARLTNVLEYKNYKIIYRPYAALFMCMCVDATDNEFAVLETIHLFVETMDLYFGMVREHEYETVAADVMSSAASGSISPFGLQGSDATAVTISIAPPMPV